MKKKIPKSFIQGMRDIQNGKEIDLDTALYTKPTKKKKTKNKTYE